MLNKVVHSVKELNNDTNVKLCAMHIMDFFLSLKICGSKACCAMMSHVTPPPVNWPRYDHHQDTADYVGICLCWNIQSY